MKTENRFSHVWAVCLSILTFASFNVVSQNKNLNHLTNEQKQKKGMEYLFNNADYIFEAEMLDGNVRQYTIDSIEPNRAYSYHKLFITKIYRGGGNLRLGSIIMLDWQETQPSNYIGKMSSSMDKAIYFAKKTTYPIPIINDKIDNSIFIEQFKYLTPSLDSLGIEIYKGFGSIYDRTIIPKTYYNVEEELLKGKKDIRIDGERRLNTNRKIVK